MTVPDRGPAGRFPVDGVVGGASAADGAARDAVAARRAARADELWAGRAGGRPAWEPDLDSLLAPALLAAPPADVQRAILAAALAAAPPPGLPAREAAPAVAGAVAAPAARPLPLAAYVLVAAVLVAYVAALSWLQGALGGGGWLATLIAQVVTASELLAGRSVVGEPLALVGQPLALGWLALQRAPWLVLLPLAWFLWQRDRSALRAT